MSSATNKPIRLSRHARGYLTRRGFTEAKVKETIRTSPWQSARSGCMEAVKDFPYQAVWNGKFYATKRVRPIFVEEPTEILVITVYTYFF